MKIIDRLREFGKTHDMERVGFILTDELVEEWYDSSPLNCVAFATTGGDGVHFSVFKDFDEDESPVVMTVPMNFGEENIVIANSLYEFLCLGSRFGFFGLEQLSYDFNSTVNEIENCNRSESTNPELKELSLEFGLKPIDDTARYVETVNAKYYSKLELADA